MQDQSENFLISFNDVGQPMVGLRGIFPLITEVLDNAGAQQGALADGDITDARQPVISGKGIPNSQLVIDITGTGGLKFVQVDEHGNWSYTPDTPLADGTHRITVYQADLPNSKSSFMLSVNQEGPVRPMLAGIVDDVGDVTGLLPNGSFTDDRRPTFTGSGATPNGELRIQFGQHVFPIDVDSEGNWSWTPPFDMDFGKHFVTIQDLSNGTNSELFTFDIGDGAPAPVTPVIEAIFDNVGSSQGSLFNGATTDDLRPTLRGTAAPNADVSIYDHGVLVFTVTVDANGNWSWESDTDLAAGTHSFQVQSGSQTSNSFVLTLQPEAPPAPLAIDLGIDDVGCSQGELSNGATTDDMRPTLRGKAAPNADVSIYDHGVLVGTAIADRYGNWSWESDTALAAGTHSFQARTGDQTSDSFVLILQPSPAAPAISSAIDDQGSEQGQLANGSVTDDAHPQLLGTGVPNTSIAIYHNGHFLSNVLVDSHGNWTYTTDGLEDGVHSFSVSNAQGSSEAFVLTIQGGGYSDKPALTSVIDNVGPSQGELANGATTDDTTPTFSGVAKPGSWVTIRDGSNTIGQVQADEHGNWSFTPQSGLTVGDHTINFVSILGESSFQLTIAPPVASIVAVYDNVGAWQGELANGATTDDDTPRLTGKATPNSVVFLYDNGKLVANVTTDEHGYWEYTTASLSHGTHSFTVASQLGTSDPFVLNIEAAPPSDPAPTIDWALDQVGNSQGYLADGATTDDRHPLLSGTAMKFVDVSIYDGGVLIATVTANDRGQWSWRSDTDLSVGTHNFQVRVGDQTSDTFDLTIETPAPQPLIIENFYDSTGNVQGWFPSGSTTDDSTPRLSGTATPLSTVDIYDNGFYIATVHVNDQGHWEWLSPEVAEGTHTFQLRAGDQVSDAFVLHIEHPVTLPPDPWQPTIDWAYDNVGPWESQGYLESGSTTDDTRPMLSGKVLQSYVKVSIYDNGELVGTALALEDGRWYWESPASLEAGTHRFEVRIGDQVSEPFVLNVEPPASAQHSVNDAGNGTGAEMEALLGDASHTDAFQIDAAASHGKSPGDIGALSIADVVADEGDALFDTHDHSSGAVTDIAAQVATAALGLGDVTFSAGALAEAPAATSSDFLSQWEVAHPVVH